MAYLVRNGQEVFADVYVRPVGAALIREIVFPYDPDIPREAEPPVDVSGLTDFEISKKVGELIREVAPYCVAHWLGKAWKAEIPASRPVWTGTS